MKEYRVTFLVEADNEQAAVDAVYDRLGDGGEADEVEMNFSSGPIETN